MVRRIALGCALVPLLAAGAQAQGQGLKSSFSDLFSFGDCGTPLCLDGSVNVANGHGNHFIPATAAGNSTVIQFITDAIGQSAANTPLSAASSGASFTIVGGVPVRSSISAGPILGERSQTLGKGRFFLGANVTGVSFSTLNGAPLDNLVLNFVHEDTGAEGLGDPVFENDLISVALALDIKLLVSSLFFTTGLTDYIDIGVAVPFVRTSISGASEAQISPFGTPALHFFGGDQTDPILRAATSIDQSATGIGDVTGRVKINLAQSSSFGAAILGDVRFATGDEENLLGSGATAVRGLGILAAQFGNYSPHLNVGYTVRTGQFQNDTFLATLGFDDLLTDWATLAFDLISEWQVGENKIALPEPVGYQTPFIRVVNPTSFPARRANLLNASVGMKFTTRGGTNIVLNGIAPLRKTSLQADFVWSGGLEFSF